MSEETKNNAAVNGTDPAILSSLPSSIRKSFIEQDIADTNDDTNETEIKANPVMPEGQIEESQPDGDKTTEESETPADSEQVSQENVEENLTVKQVETKIKPDKTEAVKPDTVETEEKPGIQRDYEKLYAAHKTLQGKYNSEIARLRSELESLKAEKESTTEDDSNDELSNIREKFQNLGYSEDDIEAFLSLSKGKQQSAQQSAHTLDGSQETDYLLNIGLGDITVDDVMAQPALQGDWIENYEWNGKPLLDELKDARATRRINDADAIVRAMIKQMKEDNVWVSIPGRNSFNNQENAQTTTQAQAPVTPRRQEAVMPKGAPTVYNPLKTGRSIAEINREYEKASNAFRVSPTDVNRKKLDKLEKELYAAVTTSRK